jgi:hypothetical protein
MDEKQLLARIQFLAHKLFIADPSGMEFIQLMKNLHLQTKTFPQSDGVITRHGGPLAWAAFREGQVTLLQSLEALGRNFQERLDAEMKSKMEIGV